MSIAFGFLTRNPTRAQQVFSFLDTFREENEGNQSKI